MASTSFIEHLAQKYSLDFILKIAKESTLFDAGMTDNFNAQDVNLEKELEEWVN